MHIFFFLEIQKTVNEINQKQGHQNENISFKGIDKNLVYKLNK